MIDQLARQTALDPAKSFIVQAPAGSGKTELLTQRYLALLGEACQEPEEIIAITFTRKAAAQMKERILTALHAATNSTPPSIPHRLLTWQLAKNALNKDQIYHWQLLQNPQRLRILTIDSLCNHLSRQLPILSGNAAPERIVKDALFYYQQAVDYVIIHLTPHQLLAHLDNQITSLQRLCIDMLKCRDQWLPYIISNLAPTELRQRLEHNLQQLVAEVLQSTDAHFQLIKSELFALCQYAAQNLRLNQSDHLLCSWAELSAWPNPDSQNLHHWQGLANLLITQAGTWRNKIDKNCGFPPKTAEKQAFEILLKQLSAQENLLEHLNHVLACPPIHYQDSQWEIISALIELLPILAAQLQLVFHQRNVIDFIELNLAASRALGEDDQPTDLALALDYRIQHILVDEFQDTSVVQFKLLEKLITGWQPGDGRSIFLVGDPMQSIYRFRNAEVSLFVRASQFGIGSIPLIPLTLKLNFRSSHPVVAWFNEVFPKILAPENDLTTGAIAYTPIDATQSPLDADGIYCYRTTHARIEAQCIVDIIQNYYKKNIDCSMAILVRSRQQLIEIIPALKTAQLSFQAVEIEHLAERSEIEDLFALTKALLHRGDRVAWLSVLRAPYCGLMLADLHVIAQAAKFHTIYESLLNYHQLTALSIDGQQRLQRVVRVLSQALPNRGRTSMTAWIEATWLALGGPAGLNALSELDNIRSYFQLLNDLELEYSHINLNILQYQLKKLVANSNPQGNPKLQIMTIHKAKGLEFDHVILPGLHRKPPPDPHRLLLWLERVNANSGKDLILASIKEASEKSDRVYDYLKAIENKKLRHEARRLLYVAATRAKHSLHLIATLSDEKSNSVDPNSFLAMLGPHFQENYSTSSSILVQNPDITKAFHRITADWQLPLLPNGQQYLPETAIFNSITPPVIQLNNKQPALIGTVIHEELAKLAEKPVNYENRLDYLNQRRSHWEKRFTQLGLFPEHRDESLRVVSTALVRTLEDPRGQWILSPHPVCYNEYPLSALLDKQIVHVIIDRLFMDREGVCWIIDYKTSQSTVQRDMQEYYQQLSLYKRVVGLTQKSPIRLGLYFPLTSEWIEW